MKRIGILLACVGALALPAASLAGDGTGGTHLAAHLARATARVATYTAKCKVASPAAKCANAKAKLTARFTAWEAKIQARIVKVNQRPDSAAKSARLSRLQDALAQIDALKAQL
jgi:hypothetical protein